MTPFDNLPDAVTIGGQAVPVNPDFRVGIAFEQAVLQEPPDLLPVLTAFYSRGLPDVPDLAAQAFDRLQWFYRCGQEEKEPPKKDTEQVQRARGYDFAVDADALLASFRAAYDIDLDTAKLHWWTFRRLMFGLPVDTPFMQRIHYRTADLSKLSREEKKHYRKMRELFALDKRPGERQMTAAERDAATKARVQRKLREAAQK